MDVSYYRFPNDENRRSIWMNAVTSDKEDASFDVKKSTFVCSKHFLPCDFLSNVANGFLRLKESAVPSVFNYTAHAIPIPAAVATIQNSNGDCSSASNVEDGDVQVCSATNSPGREALFEEPEQMESEESRNLNCSCNKGSIVDSLTRELADKDAEIQNLRRELFLAKEHARRTLEEKQKLELELMKLEKEHDGCPKRYDVDSLCTSDERTLFYTGLPSLDIFDALHEFLDPGENGCNILRQKKQGETPPQVACGRTRKLSTRSELFLVLVRLRLGLFEQDLAERFGISQSTVSRICTSWLNFMYVKLGKLPLWQSRSVVDQTLPKVFLEKYPTTRVILDATEIRSEVASSLGLQSSTYSTYKSANTFKRLVGIAPNGLVSFVSELFTGCMSDRECVIRSGFLDLPFEDGDSVMADKGFTIADILQRKNVHLNIPPFLRNEEFSAAKVHETKDIASLRIHVERRIQRIKTFHIFDRVVPLSLG
ncbi:uncharacterized protein LOC135377729 [Ornithodoros turicata]|uniref:uncharacterized protein LOC135377729 n=1 Tax=Ornithodoros turicata TaxID=34597 RepID=UPI003138DD7B